MERRTQLLNIFKGEEPSHRLLEFVDQLIDPAHQFRFFRSQRCFIAFLPADILLVIFEKIDRFWPAFCLVRSVCKSWKELAQKWVNSPSTKPLSICKQLSINFFSIHSRVPGVAKSFPPINHLIQCQNALQHSLECFENATRNLSSKDGNSLCAKAESYRKIISSFPSFSKTIADAVTITIPFENPSNLFESALNEVALLRNKTVEQRKNVFKNSLKEYIGFLRGLKLESFFIPSANIEAGLDSNYYQPSSFDWNVYLSGVLSLNLTSLHLQNYKAIAWDVFELLASGKYPNIVTVAVDQLPYCPCVLVRENVIVFSIQNLVINFHNISELDIATFIANNCLGTIFPNLTSLEFGVDRDSILDRAFRFSFALHEFQAFIGHCPKLCTFSLIDPRVARPSYYEPIPHLGKAIPTALFSFFGRSKCDQGLHHVAYFSVFFIFFLSNSNLKLYQNIIQVGQCNLCDLEQSILPGNQLANEPSTICLGESHCNQKRKSECQDISDE